MNRLPFRRVLRYALVGLATFAVYVAVGALLKGQGMGRAAQASLAFIAAVTLNYLLQRAWVFEDRRPVSMSLPQYAVMIGLGYAINVLAFVILSPRLPLLAAQFAAASLVVLSNAALSFHWVFGRQRRI